MLVGTAVHVDWHLARGHHFPHSGNWPYHWSIAIPVFAALAWYAGRGRSFRDHAWLIGPGLILGELLEPLFEIAFLGATADFAFGTARQVGFGEFVVVGLVTYIGTLSYFRRRS